MRKILNVIKKYIETAENEKFVIHWKNLAQRLSIGIKKGYEEKNYEPTIVKLVETIINYVNSFETIDKKFKISTKSIFIHGNKSQVQFEYYGKKTQRELGDIIFILSVIYNGKKYFEKITINQVKKSKSTSWRFHGSSAREQLYLLSRFPTFRGTNNSLIPNKEYNLPNYSGCLGSYGLLYYPGDFAFISSKILEVILSNKRTLKLEDLILTIKNSYFPLCCLCVHLLNNINIIKYLDILIHFCLHYAKFFPFGCNLPVLGNNCIAYNLYDFCDKYMRGLIGELTFAKYICYNHLAFQFLQDLLSAIEKKAKKDRLENLQDFISSFRQYGYDGNGGKDNKGNTDINYENGGFGIIYTAIDLGEGKQE